MYRFISSVLNGYAIVKHTPRKEERVEISLATALAIQTQSSLRHRGRIEAFVESSDFDPKNFGIHFSPDIVKQRNLPSWW